MSQPLRLSAYYLENAIFRPERVIEAARVELAGVEFDTLIGTGLSGALILPMLARALDKHFAVVRKEDNSHSHQLIEGTLGDRWLFVDDLIDSGSTLIRVHRQVQYVLTNYRRESEFMGAFLYCNPEYRSREELRVRYFV